MELKKRSPKIFIVSGKASSGKDTTCAFISDYAILKSLKSVNLQFSTYIKMYAKKISNWNGDDSTKPRSLLQILGSEVIRNNIDGKFFIRRIIEDIKVYSYHFDIITISDARFPDELDDIYNEFENVYRVNIKRPLFNNDLNKDEKKHISELALDDYKNYDYVIINDGDLNDLNKKIKNIMDEVL